MSETTNTTAQEEALLLAARWFKIMLDSDDRTVTTEDLQGMFDAMQKARAQQPAKVSLAALAKVAQKNFPVVRTGPDENGNWSARPLEIEVFEMVTKSILESLKAQLRVKGVEIEYE